MPVKNHRIAVIIDTYDEYCQGHILSGLYRTAADLGFSLTTFPSTTLITQDDIKTHFELFNNIVTKDSFEGVIIFTGALSEHTSMEKIEELIKTIDLPTVSIAGKGGNCASIEIDNASGVRDVITHLIDEHDAKRIACITGPYNNSESVERLQAYKDTLKEHNLPIDDLLIATGDFSEQGGIEGIRQLINNGFDFDAVVCADDITAIGAVKELKRQEIFVPDYVMVTGFDNIDEASMFSPSLTTVRQPFAELGSQAVKSLNNFFNTHHKDGEIYLKTEAIIRESCGCIPEEIRLLRENNDSGSVPKKKWLTPDSLLFLKLVTPSINLENKKFRQFYGVSENYRTFLEASCSLLWNYYYESIKDFDSRDQFIHSFSSILTQHSTYSKSFHFWEKVLSELNGITMMLTQKKLGGSESLTQMLQEAQLIFISHTSKTTKLHEQQLKEKSLLLHEATEHILNCRSRVELITTITKELLELEVVDAALVLFDDDLKAKDGIFPKEAVLELLISNKKERQINIIKSGFPIVDIVPESVQTFFVADNWIILPLYFRDNYFGHLLISVDKRLPQSLYEELRFHISVALYLKKVESLLM